MPPNGVENPYRPPASATSSGKVPSRRIGWKIYLWVQAFSYPFLFLAFGASWVEALELVDMTASAVGLSGLFGHAYRRRLASAAFWKLWLPLQIGWDMLVVLLLAPLGAIYRFPGTEPGSITDQTIEILFVLPLYYALFRYAFRSPEIWRAS